ncbi:imm11 family protein [Flavobacterium columnare]|uniref:imm11 family protein n=1 Tax=Flavobacterium columnare TaxID=996 RepID=UPI003C2F6D7C
MNYRFSTFYKRDVNFVYEQELNSISWMNLRSGAILETKTPLVYTVDKIDAYIGEYDFLPVIGIPLVSDKVVAIFEHLNKQHLQFIPVVIKDKLGNQNTKFYALNILNTVPCLDKEKSIFELDEDDDYDIKKFFIKPDSLLNYSIVRMEEHRSYIIVTEEFKRYCEEAGLKGVEFIEEGNSIYTDI